MKTVMMATLLSFPPLVAKAAESCQVRLILFTPTDVAVPDGYQQRINQIVTYTESFYQQGLKRWGHTKFVSPFRRTDAGDAEILLVKGQHPKAHYKDATVRHEAIATAQTQYQLEDVGLQVWWIMVYIGDPPARFRVFRGAFDPKSGGWSVCNYDSRQGEIDPRDELGDELPTALTLKAMIHELGHGFQLPHIGPQLKDESGNSLMGPTHASYRRVAGNREKRVYLTEAAAAMLSTHPAFRGAVDTRGRTLPRPTVDDLTYSAPRGQQQMIVRGRVRCEVAPKFALVADLSEVQPGEYWTKTYAGDIAADGTFEVTVTEPAPADGKLIVWFVFANGDHTGDGRQRGRRSGIEHKYRFVNGHFHP
ncbi:MAG: hypothetical protein HUJ26_11265 [Planctomycetaceae bacterium]|nr:hypothetical protein [Planctomycetaceae bacterium]